MVSPDQEELTINAGGKILGGWQEILVERSVERLPSSFYIRLTERYPGDAGQVSILPGTACTVSLSGDLILTGYIDQYLPALDSRNHIITVKGRSKPEDLVDLSLFGNEIGGWSLTVNTIGEAAKRIAKPFKIDVSLPDGDFELPPPKSFPINPGMTGAQLLEEMARTTGSLVWDDPQGRLVISGVGTGRSKTPLIEGQNIEAINGAMTLDQRFSDYYVLGQSYDLGSGHINQFAHVTEPGVIALGRHRTRIIPWESPDQDGAYSQKRALWEAARRYGRSNAVTVRVTGWRDADGKLWEPNSVIQVTSPAAKVDRDLVIAQVSWIRNGSNGTVAMLTCMPKEGLVPQPLIIQPAVPGTAEPAPH